MKNADMPAIPLAPREGGAIQTLSNMDGEFIKQCNGAIGLTKREYLAALAFQGLLASCADKVQSPYTMTNDAVACADALLAELERTS